MTDPFHLIRSRAFNRRNSVHVVTVTQAQTIAPQPVTVEGLYLPRWARRFFLRRRIRFLAHLARMSVRQGERLPRIARVRAERGAAAQDGAQ